MFLSSCSEIYVSAYRSKLKVDAGRLCVGCLTFPVCLWCGLFDSILKHLVTLLFQLSFTFLEEGRASKSIYELRWTILTKSVFFFSPLAAFHTSASSTFNLPPNFFPLPPSPGDWVNSGEWQSNPAAVDGWADPLRWDQCPGGGGEGGYGERCPPLAGWPRGPGSWPLSCCPFWLSAWPGRPLLPPRRRPLWNLKVSSEGL